MEHTCVCSCTGGTYFTTAQTGRTTLPHLTRFSSSLANAVAIALVGVWELHFPGALEWPLTPVRKKNGQKAQK